MRHLCETPRRHCASCARVLVPSDPPASVSPGAAAEQRRREEDSAAQAAAAEASDRVPGDGRAALAEARMAGTGDVDDWMGLDTGQVTWQRDLNRLDDYSHPAEVEAQVMQRGRIVAASLRHGAPPLHQKQAAAYRALHTCRHDN